MASTTKKTVSLKIKSATSGLSDLSLTCFQADSVIDVKKQISNLLPSHPPLSSQKLVYSGRILEDSEVLKEFLRWDDDCEAFTFHLVCKLPNKPVSSHKPPVAVPAPAAPTPSPAAQTVGPSPTMEEMMAQFSRQYSATMESLGGEPSEAEIAALQALYNQYISLYMQFLASQGAALPSLGNLGHHPLQPPVLEGREAHVQPAVAPAEPDAAAAAGPGAAPNAALVMNAAAGGAVGQEEAGGAERQRDVLDWVYVVTRVLLLVSIIYFHSSFLRLAAVTGLAALVYVLQNRRMAAARRQRELDQAQVALRQATAEVRRMAGNQEEQQDEGREPGETEAEISESETDSETEPGEAPGKLAVALTFITSLVTSIIPEQNQVI